MTAPDLFTEASRLHRDALVWDAHACLPLHPDCDVTLLRRHHAAGATFVSVNIGMDMNPLEQIFPVIASFRAQIAAHPEAFVPVDTVADVERAKAEGRLAVGFDLEGGVPLCGRPEMVGVFHALGVRQVHLAYNRNNEIGGGCYDEDIPLSPLGRQVVEAIHGNGMLMDLSHTGHRTSLDIAALGLGPVIFSHSNPRNIQLDLRNITAIRWFAGADRAGGPAAGSPDRPVQRVPDGAPAGRQAEGGSGGVRARRLSLIRAGVFGGDEGTRTPDPLLAKEVLSQLSYIPTPEWQSYQGPWPG